MPSTSDAHDLLLETRPPLLRAFAQKSRDRAPPPTSAIEKSIHEHDFESMKPCPPAHAAACIRHASRAFPPASDHPSRGNQPSPPDQRPRWTSQPGTSRPEHPHPSRQAPRRRASPQPNATRTSPVTFVSQDEAGKPAPQSHDRPANMLAHATSGPPHLRLRDKEQDPLRPGCLHRRRAPLQELGRFSTGCPQAVDYLPAPLCPPCLPRSDKTGAARGLVPPSLQFRRQSLWA
jgi:hypothetical protein